ncbi:MAG: FecR domain-containing protein [Candidatus Odyssella sp.]|nr:FecR domain-containing protein [Candidatus Odyssella sp.]
MPAQRFLMAARGLLAALALALAPAAAEAQIGTKAGVAAAVRGPVQQISYRTPEASVGRTLAGGQEIFLGDRIVTGPGGGLQILLLDGTTFSLGPNTSMVIDEFVFNPATGTGRLTASIARGTLRVISGRLARQEQEAVRVRTPTATVGVRGTMAVFAGGPNGFFIGLFGIGADNSANRPQSYLIVYGNGGSTGIYRTGFGCTVTPANPACNPQPVGPEFLSALLGQIGGQLRQVSLEEFQRLTGLDLVEALRLLQTQGGFERLQDIVTKVLQDQNRPGAAPPPPTTCYPYCG